MHDRPGIPPSNSDRGCPLHFHLDTVMHSQVPRRLSLDEHPSLPRLVQLVLCDDEWARVDAYRVSSVRKTSPQPLICPPGANTRRILSFISRWLTNTSTASGWVDVKRKNISVGKLLSSNAYDHSLQGTSMVQNPVRSRPVTYNRSNKRPRSRCPVQLHGP